MNINRAAIFALLSALVYLEPATVSAGPADGVVVSATKVIDNGPDASRFNLVIMGDGYTNAQLTQFAQDVQDFIDFLFDTPPFSNSCRSINVWRIDVASNESGSDDPAAPADDPMTPDDESQNCAGGTGAAVNTYFDSTFCSDGVIRRLLGSNNALAVSVLNSNVPEWDQALILVNSTIYGGSGGQVGVTSLSGTWENIAIHEFGHSAFGLADEYEYYSGCSSGETGQDNHPAAEPAQPNVTIETDPLLIKWAALIEPTTPIPTTNNANCSMCDSQADPYAGNTVVGLYEGAHYYHCDGYRPVFRCMMRDFAPFCPVCTQRILETLAPFTPPNEAPNCDADGPYTAECQGASTSVTLDGSGSADPDCNPLTFTWSGPFAGGTASGSDPTVTFAGLGTFPVDLTVDDGPLDAQCSTSVTVQDTTDPSITAPLDLVVECTDPSGTPVTLGTPTVADVCDSTVTVTNDAPVLFPLGQTTVTWTATDDSANAASDNQSVTVADTTPPQLTVNLSPVSLWPPNHKLVTINALITVSDVCDAVPVVRLSSITSNEPDNGLGDGDTVQDIQQAALGTDDRAFSLRAERKGGGGGRVYTVTYVAEDGSGNTTEVSREVVVPANQGP